MAFPVDFDGVEMGSGGGVPAGRYNLRIVAAVEKVSKKGSPMVVVDYEVMDGPYAGRLVKFHYVVFFQDKMAPGAGMSKTFLKTIGLPYDGKITVDPAQWIGRCLVGKIAIEKEIDKNGNETGNEYPRVKFVDKYETDYTAKSTKNVTPDGEADPFDNQF